MRIAIADVFVNRDLWPISFTHITKNDEIFAELARAAARSGRGRRYLRRALDSLRGENQWSSRMAILDDAI
jgi:hypothetical protein